MPTAGKAADVTKKLGSNATGDPREASEEILSDL